MIELSAKDYLGNTSDVKVAHLVEVELPGSLNVFEYWTDFRSNITHNGKVYEAGKVTTVSNVTLTVGLTNYKVSVTVPGEFDNEINTAMSEDSYEGRKLKIYRAYLTESNEIISMQEGGPLVLFEGTIVNIGVKDPITSGASTITWECAGEFQDFEKINGRLTDDANHRALISTGTGESVPSDGAYRPEYKTDTGFLHAGQTISSSIPYLTTETEYYFKKKWHGLSGSLKTREVEVEREIDISLSLTARYLPVIYGVRKVQGIPVFADVLQDEPTRMIVVFAVCEGEIDGFLNVYVDGVSTLCGPGVNNDESARCMGNMATGDTLALYTQQLREEYRNNIWKRYPYDRDGRNNGEPDEIDLPNIINDPTNQDSSIGTSQGERFNIAAEGGPITMTFYNGTADQEPDSRLVEIAQNGNFLLQNVRKKPDGSPWGPEYWAAKTVDNSGAALLDTAYVVCEFSLSEDRTSIPEVEFIVQGKKALSFNGPANEYIQTLNPVWHTLDYITNGRFGPGLSINSVIRETWEDVANQLSEVDTSYETNYLTMWRYIGWQSATGTRARMQCNTIIDTSNPSTKELETLLDQYRGTIIPWKGKYDLSVENDYAPVADILPGEVIGSIRVNNKSNRDKWNSITASIQNPELNWGTTQVSFFDSEALAEDKGIKKQGRAVFKHITNYYTARSWAEYILKSSRFSNKSITFTTYFKYFYLKPNDNITFTYNRYGFTAPNNKFRVKNVTDNSNGTIELTLERYDSSNFLHTSQSEDSSGNTIGPIINTPQNLSFVELPTPGININTPDGVNCGLLFWDVSVNTNDILRYDVAGYGSIKTAPLSNIVNIGGVDKQYYLLENIQENTEYVFKVATVYRSGTRSAYEVINVTTSIDMSPPSLPKVEGFRVINKASDGSFTGPNLELEWDTYPHDIDNFEIEIQNVDNVSLFSTNTINYTYTYTYSQNSSIFAALENSSGAYRILKPRIRAVKGTTESDWSEL